jgi:hypothetical protein
MKKIFHFAIGGILLSNLSIAQNETDALRYSQTTFGGTARSNAMGGAFGALGADFSSLSTNPAGIAIYKKSEMTITPSFFNQTSNSNMNGASLQDSKANFNLGNMGFVFAYYNDKAESKWKGVSFGIGYNRMNNFNNRIEMQTTNSKGSLLDVYLADGQANGFNNSDQFGTQLAWNSNLVWQDSASGNFYHVLPYYGETQKKYIESSGSQGETVFSLGANYDDKLYVGGTLGIQNIHYSESSQYTESMANDTVYGFKNFTLKQSLSTTGTGVNFKFGMIYKPINWMRIGAAFHSPTYFSMHDSWNSSISSVFTGSNAQYSSSASSPAGTFDYSLTTPARAVGSVGFVIKKMGLISADYEIVDYSSARLNSSSYDFINENQAIGNKYTAAQNVRVGGELRLQPLSIRAGAAYYGSPYRNGGSNGARTSITGGIGFREQNFFIDFAYVYTMTKDSYYFYDPTIAYVDPSSNTLKNSSILMTVGFKF